jgi:erythromycin esterase-like protein
MVLDVLALEPKMRVALWAHVAHLGREYVIGMPTMGQHLAAALGSKYRVYAMLAYAGSARAWDPPRKIGVIAHEIPAVPSYSVESVLKRHSNGDSVTYWEFSAATGEAKQWLDGIHPIGEFGAVYPSDKYVFVPWNLQSVDGAILHDRVTPSVPTPTGARFAKFAPP